MSETWRAAKKNLRVRGQDGQAWRLAKMINNGDGTAMVTMERYHQMEPVVATKLVNYDDPIDIVTEEVKGWRVAKLENDAALSSHLFIMHNTYTGDLKGKKRGEELQNCHNQCHDHGNIELPHTHIE